jgi:hypothetical protein
MRTGFSGTFVIAWTQVEVEGLTRAPLSALSIGASWRWSGDAVCVDGPRDVLVLNSAIGKADLHQRAAHSVRRLIGSALAGAPIYRDPDAQERLFDGGFDVTDGVKRYEITLIDTPDLGAPLVMFLGEMPPKDTDLWVVSTYMAAARTAPACGAGAVICFTPGTRISTPDGPRLVEHLSEGDWVHTKDNGPQALRWIGGRRISGARLYVTPALRPVRFRADALGLGRPDKDLVVSPHHRMLVAGNAARALFNADEVLVAAKDLVNDRSIVIDRTQRELQYIHLLFDAHQVIVANGLETESFHPDCVDIDEMSGDQKRRLLEGFPGLGRLGDGYGPSARRGLTGAEAAILMHDVA